MDYLKLARTALDEFLDKVEDEVQKLLEEKPVTEEPTIDKSEWYQLDVKIVETTNSLSGTPIYKLVTSKGAFLDSSYDKDRLIKMYALD